MDSKLDVQEESDNKTVDKTDLGDEQRIKFQDWGFQLDRLFEVAYRFYKRNEGKAFNPSFDTRNQMNALIMQARYGNLDGAKLPDLGTLDLVGKRRRQEWSQLHGMSKLEAMSKFICSLDEMCPLFKAHTEAVKLSSDNFQTYNSTFEDLQPAISIPSGAEGEQLQTIYNSLCRQTHSQFKNYAERQYPNDILKQKNLISSLQAQYYKQYISQMHPELSSKLQNLSDSQSLSSNSDTTTSTSRASPVRFEKQSSPDHPPPTSDLAEIPPTLDQPQTQEPVDHSIHIDEDGPNIVVEHRVNSLPTAEQLPMPVEEPKTDMDRNSVTESFGDNPKVHSAEQSEEKSNIKPEELRKNYERIEPSHIGPFESFPEPKPITKPNFMQRICPENPHLVHNPAIVKASESTGRPQLSSRAEVQKPLDTIEPPHLELPPVSDIISSSSSIEILKQDSSTNDVEHHQQPSQIPPSIHHGYPLDTVKDEWPCNHEVDHQASLREPPELWGPPTTSQPVSPDREEQNVSSITIGPPEAATQWTKRGIREFRDSLVDDQHGGEYSVKQGSRLIIQVPTYPTGSYIYWEFATDGYDIGFGVDFVHEDELEEPLAMQIFEDSDDDDDDDDIFDEEEAYYATAQIHNNALIDPELGLNQYSSTNPTVTHPVATSLASNITSNGKRASYEKKRAEKLEILSRTIPIVPIYRRDSHEDVIVGRHKYPGKGYYRLKFDNTYSVLRSKTLFFRVCFFT